LSSGATGLPAQLAGRCPSRRTARRQGAANGEALAAHRVPGKRGPDECDRAARCLPARAPGAGLDRGPDDHDGVPLGGRPERAPARAGAELVRAKSDVIVVSGTAAIRAARRATSRTPIVIAAVLGDPVASGLVASLSRPGGNITGLASEYEQIVTKQVQLLAEAILGLSQLVLLRHAAMTRATDPTVAAATAAADTLGLRTRLLEVREVADFEGAFRAARVARAQAIHVLPSPFLNAHRRHLIDLAARYRLPAMYEFREYVQDGGLVSYGVSLPDMYRRAASYVDHILKGTKPGDLPIERPTKFELVINLKTAKALGLTIPLSLLQRADQIIE
jgi:putative ABC transport system substrate-binding protein